MNNNTESNYSKDLIPVGKAKDITGMKYGKLTAIGRTHNKGREVYWLCRCDCGTYKSISASCLRSKGTVSCGCYSARKARERLRRMTKEERIRNAMIDLKGKRFGKLVAIKPTEKRIGTNIVWELKCDCGNTTHVHTGNLGEHHRKTRSCGCLHLEVVGVDLTGNRYGRLSVIKQGEHIGNKIGWLCKCDCGELTTVSGTHLNSGATRSCGCLQIELSSGKNNHNYNPNKTDEERLKRRYILGKHTLDGFRNKVYKRDDYTCRVCYQVGGSLNAHHLDGWNWAVDKRFDVDNGVTLCECCHNEFHRIYGKGNNTKEQFEEYHNKTRELAPN